MSDPHDADAIWSDPAPGPRRPPRPPRASGPPPAPPTDRSGALRWVRSFALVAVGMLVGAGIAVAADRGADEPESVASSTPSEGSEAEPTSTMVEVAPTSEAEAPPELATTVPESTTTVAPPPASGPQDWPAIASALGPLTEPSDCGLPLGVPESLPNAARGYRGGVHEGIDFICAVEGRDAVAALDGQIVMANNTYVEPTPSERLRILDTARSIGDTPPWTLAMLFGRFVVIDHGVRPGVGHVVTIYAHLDEIDPAIRPGLDVDAGTRLGEIGNRGTESAGTGEVRPQAIHLHWEIHVDDEYLGQGLTADRTSAVYATLFGR